MSNTLDGSAVDGAKARAPDWAPGRERKSSLLENGFLGKSILNGSDFAIIATDAAGVVQFFNSGAERMLGYAAEDVVNKKALDLLLDPQQLIDCTKALCGEFATSIVPGFDTLAFKAARGIGGLLDLNYVRVDDSRFPARASITALRDGKAEIIGYLIVANDNSAAQLAKDAAKREKVAHEMFRLAVETCPGGMLMVDREGKIVLVNAEIERQFGYARGELIGKSIDLLVPVRLRRQHAASREAFNLRPETRKVEARTDLLGLRKDGSEFPAEVSLNPIEVDGSLMVLGVVVDISERRRVERLKAEFVATVSHELRTPLTSIVGALALLTGNAAGKLPDPALRLLRIAYTNGQRLVRLLNDILDIEKMESGKATFDFKRVEVRSLAEQAIEANRAFAECCDVRIRLDSASVAIDVRADPDRVVQAITNLLSNAIKFSPPGEEVIVAVEARNETARISVRDHGHGVPDEFKPHIFEKFAQADATDARQKGGTGLGLSIVKQIVDRLDGEVGFHDAPGGGSVFYVDLPFWARAIRLESRLVGKTQHRILLCEDNPEAAVALFDRLRQEGFVTDVALTVNEAVTRVASMPYAAILVDLQLPEGDGIDLIKRLRAQPQIYNTLLVVLSADLDSVHDEAQPSTLLNILDWLDTPIDVARLVRVLDRPIARNGNTRSRILHVDSNPELLRAVAKELGATAEVMSVDSVDEARRALAANRFDVAVLDVALAAGSGFELLHELRNSEGDAIPLVVFSPQDANPAFAVQIRAALTKSRTSIDNLVATLRKRLAVSSLSLNERGVA
jgi:PAS domain S-box-containing protein